MSPKSLSAHRSLIALRIGFCALALSAGCATEENTPPQLLTLEDQRFEINRAHQIDIQAFDAEGDPLTFSYVLSPPAETESQGAGAPRLQKVGGDRALFTWTPGIADAEGGTQRYQLTIRVADDRGGEDTETLSVEVSDPESGGAGIRFIAPEGNGTLLDLRERPCVEDLLLTVEAPRLRSDQIEISLSPPSPVGAILNIAGPKQASLRWCPTEAEMMNSLSHPFLFEARGEGGELAQKSYLIQLRLPADESCPGAGPEIFHEPLPEQRGVLGYTIEIELTDDLPIVLAPSLSYQVLPPGSPPPQRSEVGWPSVPFVNSSGARWSARIPFPDLGDGEQRQIAYQIIAFDDDDPDGTRCDHRSESPVYTFLAIGDGAGPRAPRCAPCELDRQCEEGLACLPSEGAAVGLCVPPCGPECGACIQGESVDRQSGEWCSPSIECRGEEPPCVADRLEGPTGNDQRERASQLPVGALLSLTLCEGDVDFLRVTDERGEPLELRVAVLEGPIILRGYDREGVAREPTELTHDRSTLIADPQLSLIELRGAGGGAKRYELDVRSNVPLACNRTGDCPAGQYCRDEVCIEERCVEQNSCGGGHLCRAPRAGSLVSPGEPGRCRFSCFADEDCRMALGYRCKRFPDFRRSCVPAGLLESGSPCARSEECAGERVCLSSPEGYCAVGGCADDEDCAPGTSCGAEFGIASCLTSCEVNCGVNNECRARADDALLCLP